MATIRAPRPSPPPDRHGCVADPSARSPRKPPPERRDVRHRLGRGCHRRPQRHLPAVRHQRNRRRQRRPCQLRPRRRTPLRQTPAARLVAERTKASPARSRASRIRGRGGAVLALEFVADKIPGFDLIWNALQTFVAWHRWRGCWRSARRAECRRGRNWHRRRWRRGLRWWRTAGRWRCGRR